MYASHAVPCLSSRSFAIFIMGSLFFIGPATTNGYVAITFSIGAAGNANSFTDESLPLYTH